MKGATEAEKKAAEEKRKKEGPLSIEEVLVAEAEVIRDTDKLADELLKDLLAAQDANAKAAMPKPPTPKTRMIFSLRDIAWTTISAAARISPTMRFRPARRFIAHSTH